MSCPVCSAYHQLDVIIVGGTDLMCVKIPEIPKTKSCSDDSSSYNIITTSQYNVSNDDIRVLYCLTILSQQSKSSTPVVTLGNNAVRDNFVGLDGIKDGSHLHLKKRDGAKPNLTQMEMKYSPKRIKIFALSFKSDDGKLYYVNAPGTGQPLVIDSTIGPQYVFSKLTPT